jgi:hypothetical protein
MPIGKTGRYYSNPSVMRQHGDEPLTKSKSSPEKTGINANIAPPDADAAKTDVDSHKLEICKYEDGRLSLTHIHPDGATEEHDPTTPKEVTDHVNSFLAQDEPAEDEADQDAAFNSPNEPEADQQ